LPNKSNLDADGDYFPEKTTQEVIQSVKDRGLKIILYQGIFTPERSLDEIAEYLERNQTKYVLCVMGSRNEYVESLCAKFKSVRYLPYIPSPNHLAVTRQADIGLLSYDPQNGWTGCSKLNVLYCAPNKIYEFTKFGIPILGNDISGLLYPVEMNHIGAVCDFNSPKSIKNALDFISDNYTSLYDNCLNFFASVNTTDIVRKILDEGACAEKTNKSE
jgi:glycosyltransferase involved in cell wall biosynthesis